MSNIKITVHSEIDLDPCRFLAAFCSQLMIKEKAVLLAFI